MIKIWLNDLIRSFREEDNQIRWVLLLNKFNNLKYRNFISQFEKTLKNNYKNEIGPIFNYILSFIKSFPGNNYIIILDQYKSDITDYNFNGLNEIVKYILECKDILKVKLIISSSRDNTANKFSLLRNLSNIYLELNQNYLSKLINKDSLDNINLYYNENLTSTDKKLDVIEDDNDDPQTKNECIFCEKVFNKEKENLKKEILSYELFMNIQVISNAY